MENELNFYNHLESLKTIYVKRLDELNDKDREIHRLKKDMQTLIEDFKEYRNSQSDKILDLEQKLEMLQRRLSFLEDVDAEVSDTVRNYYLIPLWIRKMFCDK